MKKIAASIIAFLATFTISAHAYVALGLQYSEYYTQSQDGVTLSSKPSVFAWVTSGTGDPAAPEDSATSAAVFRPNGDSMNFWNYYSNPWSTSFNWLDLYNSPSEIPLGDYTFAFFGGTRNGTSTTLTLNPKEMPPQVPELTERSFDALTTGDVTKPIRLVFRPWMLRGLETDIDNWLTSKPILGWMGISIVTQQGEQAFVVRAADPRTASVVIPANSLKPGTKYFFNLNYITESQDYRVSYTRALSFSFTTPVEKE